MRADELVAPAAAGQQRRGARNWRRLMQTCGHLQLSQPEETAVRQENGSVEVGEAARRRDTTSVCRNRQEKSDLKLAAAKRPQEKQQQDVEMQNSPLFRTRGRRRRRPLLSQLKTCNSSKVIACRSEQQELNSTRARGATHLPVVLLVCALVSLVFSGPTECLQQQQQQLSVSGSPLEARDSSAAPQFASPPPPNAITINKLVDFLNSIQQQQQQQRQSAAATQQRRSPPVLPLGAMGQRGAQPTPVNAGGLTTPVNPFLAAAQFQPTRRQFQPQQQQQQAAQHMNRFAPQPNSPPPQLVMSRLPPGGNMFNAGGQQLFGQQRPAQEQLQAVPSSLAPVRQAATSGQQLVQRGNQQQSPFPPPPPPPPQNQVNLRPVSGFAPSGPPPSAFGGAQSLSNAINVVQSPANAIGAPPATRNLSLPAPEVEAARATSTSAPTTTSEQPTTQSPTTSTTSTAPTSTSAAESAASWNPLGANRTSSSKPPTSLAPSPDIVTVPPGYNPDAAPAQNYDIAVSAQMGGGASAAGPVGVAPPPEESSAEISPTNTSQQQIASATANFVEQSSTTSTPPIVAPTAVTTIFWSPSDVAPTQTVAPKATSAGGGPQATSSIEPTKSQVQVAQTSQVAPPVVPQRIRDNSSAALDSDEAAAAAAAAAAASPTEQGVVYGKATGRDSKPTGPPPLLGGGEQSGARSFIQSAQLDEQVRPFAAAPPAQRAGTADHNLVHKSSHAPFKPSKRLDGNQATGGGMSVNSGFTIVAAAGNQTMPSGDIQDYVAASAQEPTISAQGGQDPAEAAHESAPPAPAPQSNTVAAPPTPRVRRPTFKPKPAVPPIRIDSCIVGDESSCDQTHNERCVTEYGISSCHCKPGFARLSQLRGYCSPISAVQFSLKIDRLSDDRRLVYNHTLENSNSEEYQYLEFETVQALAGAVQSSSLAKQFMGARVHRFFERKGKVWANVSINLEANNSTRNEKLVQQQLGAELQQKIAQLAKVRQPLGESTIIVDSGVSTSREPSVSRLVDVNECASKELNDCSKNAVCTNEFGSFQCTCLAGYEDKYSGDERQKQGRVCMGCSAAYCSNRGECSILDGRKQCKCRPNFVGSRCEYDSEVWAIIIGGCLIGSVILIVTFWCLFVFNRRWRRESQKMDAMSATSGLTYNYVNSSSNQSTNSLMSPARGMAGGGPLGRAELEIGGYTMGGGGGRGQLRNASGHYAADQQAIIGSASSGSSASSQPILCNPYAAGYQYEDAGLLIAPASTGSSEQTSPSGNSYRGIIGASNSAATMSALMATSGNAYTLSGHHHHHHHHNNPHAHHQLRQAQQHHQLNHHYASSNKPLSQFHPAAEFRAHKAAAVSNLNCQTNGRGWSVQDSAKQSGGLVGYYLVNR